MKSNSITLRAIQEKYKAGLALTNAEAVLLQRPPRKRSPCVPTKKSAAGKRWTKEEAAYEFNINPRTLTGRMRSAAIDPGPDGCWSTQQICRAVFGDLAGERLRLTREQADKLAIENAESRADLVNSAEEQAIIERGMAAMTQVVLGASNLEDEDKDKLLNRLREAGQGVVDWINSRKAAAEASG